MTLIMLSVLTRPTPRVPAPTDLSARPLKGEGWSLELANGWEVVPGARPGDVTVRKK
jgi:hypothetical protein